jgi:RNA polymerase sigma-70 factor (ECF subfamily)
MNEAELIHRAVTGDEAAWQELLATHRPRLRRIVAVRLDQRLQGRIDPSDIIQEAFVDAARGLKEFARRNELTFFLWLRWLVGMKLTHAHRTHLQFQARDARREIQPGSLDMPHVLSDQKIALELLGNDSSISERAARNERRRLVVAALEELDPLDRQVLVLRHFEDLSNSETARVLKLTASAASKRYIRSLQKIRSILRGMSDFESGTSS